MKNKNGFISMTLVYSFLIVFLFLMLAILHTYSEKNKYIEAINDQIDNDISKSKETRLTLLYKIINDNSISDDSKISYNKISNSSAGNGNGLFYTENKTKTDENGDGTSERIYFFRGNANNHVVFADMCFRIIRTSENGSIRLKYNGPYKDGKCPTTQELLDAVAAANVEPEDPGDTPGGDVPGTGEEGEDDENSQEGQGDIIDDDIEGVEYSIDVSIATTSYTSVTGQGASDFFDSKIRTILENWYVTNILNKQNSNEVSYGTYVSDAIYCADRKVNSTVDTTTFYEAKKFDGMANGVQDLLCSRKDDRYNLSEYSGGYDDTGNNRLNYAVGLANVNDIIYSGGVFGEENTSYYMNVGRNYWLMTPYSYDTSEGVSMTFVDSDGAINIDKLAENSKYIVIPVVSIKSTSVVKSGDGTSSNPYIIK